MTVTLVLPGPLEAEIRTRAALPVESAAVLLVRRADLGGSDVKLLARSLHWVPDAAYLHRGRDRLTVASDGYVHALAAAERDGAIALWFHTHPVGAAPLPSDFDEKVDQDIETLFRDRSGSGAYGTLIASLVDGRLVFAGDLREDEQRPIDRFFIVGDRWHLLSPFGRDVGEIPEQFDRNVRAFGPAIQHILGALSIAVVGTGGTGSAIAEQLVRLGVRRLLLFDADRLSISNVTRVYGSTPADVGRPKVEVVADSLRAIAPNLHCETVPAMITMRRAAERLREVDIVFGCTDDNAGRLVLSRLSTYFLIPVIDVGVLLSSTGEGRISGVDARVTTLTPGAACLVCRNRIDTARAAAELMTPEERKRLADEGYAPALGQAEPAVVAFTTAVAAHAVGELLERLIGYGPDERPSELLLRLHEREISNNRSVPNPRHYCAEGNGRWGAGDEAPFLGQTWPDA